MMASATAAEYRHFKTLAQARDVDGAVAVIEGDYGGQIYFTCPVRHLRCEANTLSRLLNDLDALKWNDPEGAGLFFEIAAPGSCIPGGMGGGLVCDGVWVHPEFEHQRARVEAVIAGILPCINTDDSKKV
jgi:hypothetical protein